MKTYVPTQGPDQEDIAGQKLVEWLEREFQAIKSALDTAFDLNVEASRTTPDGKRLKDREGMFRYVQDPTLDPDWAPSQINYYHNGQWKGLADQAWTADNFMFWLGVWRDGGGTGQDGVYLKNSVVLDDAWLTIANKNTGDKPAPVPTGDPFNVIDVPGAPSFTEQSQTESALYVGTRYTLTTSGYFKAIRLNIPASMAGFSLEVRIVGTPTTTPNVDILVPEFTIDVSQTGAWIELPLGQRIVVAGAEFDILAVYRPLVGETQFTYQWDYERKNGDPDPEKAWHQSGGNANQIRFHEVSKDAGNVAFDLDNIGPGSIIEMLSSGYEWTVDQASKTGAIYTFFVDPASRAGEDTSDFRFSYYAPLPINYNEALGHYATLPNVRGFIGPSYDPSAVTLTDTAYGLDVQVQAAQISSDWDIMAFSG